MTFCNLLILSNYILTRFDHSNLVKQCVNVMHHTLLTRYSCIKMFSVKMCSKMWYFTPLVNGDHMTLCLHVYQMARILTRTQTCEHISPIIRFLDWLPVTEFRILTVTYKNLHNIAPTYLRELIEPYQPSHTLCSADQILLNLPMTRFKSYRDRSFSKTAPILWHALPLTSKHVTA